MKYKIPNNFLVNFLLIIGTIVIWSLIIYHVYNYFTSSYESLSENIDMNDNIAFSTSNSNKIADANLKWNYLDRDPFQVHQETINDNLHDKKLLSLSKDFPKNQNQSKTVASHEIKTEFILTGIILNDKSRLAVLLEPSSNKSFFLHQGESYGGKLIKEIRVNSIIIIENSTSKEIFINR